MCKCAIEEPSVTILELPVQIFEIKSFELCVRKHFEIFSFQKFPTIQYGIVTTMPSNLIYAI